MSADKAKRPSARAVDFDRRLALELAHELDQEEERKRRKEEERRKRKAEERRSRERQKQLRSVSYPAVSALEYSQIPSGLAQMKAWSPPLHPTMPQLLAPTRAGARPVVKLPPELTTPAMSKPDTRALPVQRVELPKAPREPVRREVKPDPVADAIKEVTKSATELPPKLAELVEQLRSDPAIMDDVTEVIRIGIWDFAGQAVYYTIHHIFMAFLRCIYLLTFNCSERLDKEAAPLVKTSFKDGKTTSPSLMTHLDYMRQWISAVHYTSKSQPHGAHASTMQDPGAAHADVSDIFDQRSDVIQQWSDVMELGDNVIARPGGVHEHHDDDKLLDSPEPAVVLVGTFADKVRWPQDRSALDDQLWKVISRHLGFVDEDTQHPAFAHVSRHTAEHRNLHLIDNTRAQQEGHENRPSDEVRQLQEHVARLARRSLSHHDDIPRTWLRFEKVVKRLASKSQRTITYKELRGVLSKVCGIDDVAEIRLLLSFYSQQGDIALFTDVVRLTDTSICVLDMTWLIDRIADIICVRSRADKRAEGKHYKLWKKLEETGSLSGELIQHMWRKANLTDDDQRVLIDFMQKHNLLYETPFSKSVQCSLAEKVFCVPSLIQKVADVEEFIRQPLRSTGESILSMHEVPLFFVTRDGYPIPHSVYFRLVVLCQEKWSKKPKLRYNCARLKNRTDDEARYDVVLCHDAVRGTIKCVVQLFAATKTDSQKSATSKETSPLEGEAEPLMSKVCCEVRRSLLGFLVKLGQSMFTEMKIETAIACPNSEDHQQCFRHKADHCKRDTCVPLIRKHDERYVECPDDNCDLEELPKNAKCWMSETAKFVTVREQV